MITCAHLCACYLRLPCTSHPPGNYKPRFLRAASPLPATRSACFARAFLRSSQLRTYRANDKPTYIFNGIFNEILGEIFCTGCF